MKKPLNKAERELVNKYHSLFKELQSLLNELPDYKATLNLRAVVKKTQDRLEQEFPSNQ